MQYLLEVRDIHKSFGTVKALNGTNFSVGYNEIVGLVGDNGAGKSTMAKIMMGVYTPDKGEIYFEGKKIENLSVEIARKLGIEMVYQEEALVDLHSIWRNIFMGREITRFGGFIDIKKSKTESIRLLREIGFKGDITADSLIKDLSGGERKGVAISRSMFFKQKLSILDEPTVSLSIRESKKVMDYCKKIKEKGTSSMIISHNFFELYPVVDRLIILERGTVIGDYSKKDISLEDLMELIVKSKSPSAQ